MTVGATSYHMLREEEHKQEVEACMKFLNLRNASDAYRYSIRRLFLEIQASEQSAREAREADEALDPSALLEEDQSESETVVEPEEWGEELEPPDFGPPDDPFSFLSPGNQPENLSAARADRIRSAFSQRVARVGLDRMQAWVSEHVNRQLTANPSTVQSEWFWEELASLLERDLASDPGESAEWEEEAAALYYDNPHAGYLQELAPLEQECGQLVKEESAFGKDDYNAWKPLLTRAYALLLKLHQDLALEGGYSHYQAKLQAEYNVSQIAQEYPGEQLTTDCDARLAFVLRECRSAYVALVYRE